MSLRTHLYTCSLLLVLFLPQMVSAATLSLDPSVSTVGPGDTFITTVRIDNQGDCVNAANIVLTYPKAILRAVDFSRGESIFSLWVQEPKIDTDQGTIEFSGGIPGGYCGRIAGDAALTNVLGKVIFTVVGTNDKPATIDFASTTAVYLNDGQGTLAALATHGAMVHLSATGTLSSNPWLTAVKQDATPPQSFTIDVESTSGVFGGKYYIVFSTTDKESGLDHFDIYEKGGWKRITSPYLLQNQSLFGVGDIQVRAVDKAGNIRNGTYSPSTTPKRQLSFGDFVPFIILLLVLLLASTKIYLDHRKLRIQRQ